MTKQDELVELVKQKGVGKTMSKSLNRQQLSALTELLNSTEVNSATIATILTAFLMLPLTKDEKNWFSTIQQNYTHSVNKECHFLFNTDILQGSLKHFSMLINTVIQHKNLTSLEFEQAMSYVFSTTTPDCFKAAFLEAARLKEESMEENCASLDLCYKKSIHHQLDLPILIDIANPYDGFKRHFNLSISLAIFLGALGFPTLIHGTHTLAPKFGITPHKLLLNADKNPLKSVEEVKNCLENPNIGWGYLDQSQFCQPLHHLTDLRKFMVKRPVLATVEKFLLPLRAKKTYLVTGYTHPAYRQKTIDLLQHLNQTDKFMIVRGVEGSAQLPFDRRCPVITGNRNSVEELFSRPSDYNFEESSFNGRDVSINEKTTLTYSLAGIENPNSSSFLELTYLAIAICTHLNLASPDEIKQKIYSKTFISPLKKRWELY